MIGRWLTFGVASWCFLIGVWRHDWLLIAASLGLVVMFAWIGAEVLREDEMPRCTCHAGKKCGYCMLRDGDV